MTGRESRYVGPLYRALNPVYAREPLSGRGAELYGGRFNPKGTPALYTSLDPSTALRESNQVGSLQPTILVCYEADLGPVFDTRNPSEDHQYQNYLENLDDPGWRSAMLDGQSVPTQELSKQLIKDGFIGILVRSFAPGTTAGDLNLVLWRWSGNGCSLSVVDEEERLSRM